MEANASVRTMHTVILWMARVFVQVDTKGLYVMKPVNMVNLGHTAVRIAYVKMMLLARLRMVSVLVNLGGMVSPVNHNVTVPTMVISVVSSVCV